MHDIELIKKDPELFDRAMISRGFGEQAEKIIELDLKKRGELSTLYSLREQRNAVTREVALLKRSGIECTPPKSRPPRNWLKR